MFGLLSWLYIPGAGGFSDSLIQWWKNCFWTPHTFVMYCIALRISLNYPSAVYFSSSTKMYPHPACALFRLAQSWMLQQDDVPCNTSTAQELQFFLINNHQLNNFSLLPLKQRNLLKPKKISGKYVMTE